MEDYLKTFDYHYSVVRANSEIMEELIEDLEDVVDHVLDEFSAEYLIVKKFVNSIHEHYYHFDDMIRKLDDAYSNSKGDINET